MSCTPSFAYTEYLAFGIGTCLACYPHRGINFHVSTDIKYHGGDDKGRLPVRNVRAAHGRLNGEGFTQSVVQAILPNEKLHAVRGAALSHLEQD